MPEYVRNYNEKTAWMHQSGVEEIKAAVIAQALLDYVDACKTIISFSGEITGKNIEHHKKVKMGQWAKIHRQRHLKMPLEEYLLKETLKACDLAQSKASEAERFFYSPVFVEFCEMSRGDYILEAARQFLKDWSEDKNKGRWNLPTRPIEDPIKVNAIRKGYYNNHKHKPKRPRGRPPKNAK